jgi:hypothetical protein
MILKALHCDALMTSAGQVFVFASWKVWKSASREELSTAYLASPMKALEQPWQYSYSKTGFRDTTPSMSEPAPMEDLEELLNRASEGDKFGAACSACEGMSSNAAAADTVTR